MGGGFESRLLGWVSLMLRRKKVCWKAIVWEMRKMTLWFLCECEESFSWMGDVVWSSARVGSYLLLLFYSISATSANFSVNLLIDRGTGH